MSKIARLWCFVGVVVTSVALVRGGLRLRLPPHLDHRGGLAGDGLQILDPRPPHVKGDFYTVEAFRNALLFDGLFIVAYTVLLIVGLWLTVPLSPGSACSAPKPCRWGLGPPRPPA